MRKIQQVLTAVQSLDARLQRLEQDSEVMKTVLIVKEPGTPAAAAAFDGLRKQILAAAGERRAHLTQLAQLHAGLRRSSTVDDAKLLVQDWMGQAGIFEVWDPQPGLPLRDLFEVLEGSDLPGATHVEVLDPAYLDSAGALLRLGRARLTRPPVVAPPAPVPTAPDRTAAERTAPDPTPVEISETTDGMTTDEPLVSDEEKN
jgi:hypothetical protein